MTLEASVRITHPTGLHARPAVRLAQLAAAYDATVLLRVGDEGAWVRARSTAQVMKLKARSDATLHFRADGEQAADALAALVDFVRREFDEEEAPASDAPAPAPRACERTRAAPAAGTGERVVAGQVASEGIARGTLHVLRAPAALARRAGTAEEERAALARALADARTDLEALAGRPAPDAPRLAADLVAFQLALLDDPELVAPAFDEVDAGTPAHEAWSRLMRREIADYDGADDEYFRARAADLRDVRDRVLERLAGPGSAAGPLPAHAVVVADELTPSRFLALDRARLAGAAMLGGSHTSHVAMLARARRVPLLVRVETTLADLVEGAPAIVDAEHGRLVLAPTPATIERYAARGAALEARARAARRYLARSARTADGTAVRVYLNVDEPAALDGVDPAHCDGIGLTRTEFVFQRGAALPDEDAQLAAYARLIEWARGRPVTIRTLDAGGDKPIAGVTPQGESNPFLGVRGLRLSLARPEVFRVQLRALARAAALGPLKVMVPMVTLPAELEAARALLREEVEALRAARVAAAMPALGMMVEVPAAALTVDRFAAEFLSIGTNDLVQYVMAAGRDVEDLPELHDPLHPAVLELITRVAEHGARAHVEVSVCGEMAATPRCLKPLLAAGVRVLSVPPAALAATKAALAEI